MEQEPAAISLSSESFLTRELERFSDDEFWQYALQQANRAGEGDQHFHHAQHVQHDEYVECKLEDGGHHCWLALDALIQALPPPRRFALLPAMPSWMIGLLAWRGETLAVIDLAAYLTDSQQAVGGQSAQSKLVILHDAGEKKRSFPPIALLVADIGLTTTIVPEQMQAGIFPGADSAAVSLNWLAPERTMVIRGIYNHAPVLDVSVLLADIVECIGIAALDE